MNNELVAWTDGKGNYFDKNSFFPVDDLIPLYTHQYERPHNTVLVPCDKLAEMQAEIEALKKSCLDEIFKRTYANQSAKVMEGYWQEAQAEIEALKLQLHTTLTNRDLRTYDGKAQEK